jgi:D-glycero-D-manno-heptose 1,7-bisphosphate phosphatase
LRTLGFALVVVTNQPDVARGDLEVEVVDAVHRELRQRVVIDGLYVCLHDDADGCGCRKPAPGLLVAAATDLGLDLTRSVMVGDRWRDVEAGRRAGCRTVHLDRGYDERLPEGADLVAFSLAEAVRWIERVVVGEGVTGG